MQNDPVNHPHHYCSHPSGVEAIIITREMSFNVGNAFKYLYRCDLKGNIVQDIDKAIWYIRDEISRREKFPKSSFAEDTLYCPRTEGNKAIKAILEHEKRFNGQMMWALDRLYTANLFSRSVKSTLLHALNACEKIKNNYL
jgi:hypothetical protein